MIKLISLISLIIFVCSISVGIAQPDMSDPYYVCVKVFDRNNNTVDDEIANLINLRTTEHIEAEIRDGEVIFDTRNFKDYKYGDLLKIETNYGDLTFESLRTIERYECEYSSWIHLTDRLETEQIIFRYYTNYDDANQYIEVDGVKYVLIDRRMQVITADYFQTAINAPSDFEMIPWKKESILISVAPGVWIATRIKRKEGRLGLIDRIKKFIKKILRL